MTPHIESKATSGDEANNPTAKQYLFVIRHGDRWDYAHPEWRKTAKRFGDPPLSNLGQQQARETGIFLDSIISKISDPTTGASSIAASDIKVLCSPFLRCIQTANGILSQFSQTQGDVAENVSICPEKSVWEIDAGHNGELHACLPDLEERKCYFPRLDISHESLFVPSLPESRPEFIARCEKSIQELNKKYPYKPNSVIIIVTHAAGCVVLSKAAAGGELSDINAASPCGVFGLTRTSDSECWDLDKYDKEGGMNGYSAHLSDLGKHTIPWNHLGPKGAYSGPPMP